MKALPVVERELRAAARRGSTYWLRLAAAVALLGGFFIGLFDQTGSASDLGGRLFVTLNAVLFVSIVLLAPLLTADAISSERREGTLGLLFLTPLTPGAVVVGKGLSHLLRAGSMVLAGMPILSIPFLLGGVSWSEATYAACMDVSMMLLALTAGLAASVCCRAWGRALLLAEVFSVVAAVMLLAGAGRLLEEVVWRAVPVMRGWSPSGGLLSGTPVGIRMLLMGDVPFWGGGRGLVAGTAGLQQRLATVGGEVFLGALGAALLLLAWTSYRTARVWREKPAGPLWRWWERHFLRPRVGRVFLRSRLRRMLERNPIGWLHQYSTGARVIKWGWCLFAAAAESVLVITFNWYELLGVQLAFGAILLVALAASSAGSFQRERETGALELILVTPLREGQVIWGRLRGVYGQFLPAMAIVLGAGLFLVETRMGDYQMRRDWDSRWGELSAVVTCGVAFLSLPAIGLWYSLVCRSFLGAWVWTLCAGVLVPLIVAAAGWLMLIWTVELGSGTGSMGSVGTDQFYYPVLAVCLLASAVVHGWLVRHRLARREFLVLTS